MADRETLVRQLFEVYREIGYQGFRLRWFTDPEAVCKYPDEAAREREMRASWNRTAEEHYFRFRNDRAGMSKADIIRERARLEGVARESFFDRMSQRGRERRQEQHQGMRQAR